MDWNDEKSLDIVSLGGRRFRDTGLSADWSFRDTGISATRGNLSLAESPVSRKLQSLKNFACYV